MSLQQRMGLTRVVRYCESLHLDAPAVAGWIRPVVLLPMSAVTGLTEAQLEAVIAHELAHIRRYDALVNLFQVGVETLLFYHPAVWWFGKRVRVEREHCCDDEAVALCGSPVTYAHALTRMAESKTVPQLAMAVNRSPLVARVARLLEPMRRRKFAAQVCLAAFCACRRRFWQEARCSGVSIIFRRHKRPFRLLLDGGGGHIERTASPIDGHVPAAPPRRMARRAPAAPTPSPTPPTPSPSPVATPALRRRQLPKPGRTPRRGSQLWRVD